MNPRILTLAILLLSGALHAQWWTQLNPPANLFNNIIFSVVADKTGKLYAAGGCTDSAGENAIAVLNNGGWSELGVGANTLHAKGNIYALAFDPSGNLYSAGAFTDATGHYYVAKWNGSDWSETGPASAAQNFTGQIFSLAADKIGNIYAGGEMIDSVGNYYVSKFDGTRWQPLGSGLQSLRANGIIYAVLADASGNIYAAGQFTNAAGKWYVAKWDGGSWSELGTGADALNANGSINSLATDAGGNIYAAGDFKDGSGNQYVAKWDGSGWSALGTGAASLAANETINTILTDATGHLYAACMLSNSAGSRVVSQWSGSSWSVVTAAQGLSQFNNAILSLAADPAGNLYVAGNFTNQRGDRYVARDSAGIWTEPGLVGGKIPDQPNPMRAMAVDTGGHIFASLGIGSPSDVSVVVRWTGKAWVTLPDTANGGSATITGLAGDSLGNMYACGSFGASPGVAKWDGTGWTMIPSASGRLTINSVNHVATDKKGNVYISGSFVQNGYLYNLAKWNGSVWTAFVNADIFNFIVDPGGTIYAAYADYSNSGYNVLKIEGNTVTDIGLTGSQLRALNATNWIQALAMDGSGNLYAAGSLSDGNNNVFVSKWDGANWTVLGTDTNAFAAVGAINAMAFDGNGNLFAGGNLIKHSQTYIGKWNGSSWSTVGDATDFWSQLDLGFLARDGRGNIYADVANNVYKYIDGQSPTPTLTCSDTARIRLSANKNTVTDQSTTVEIDAGGIPDDGTTTWWIEFAGDRDFINVLSAPSANSVLTLSPGSLVTGPNTIFAKMQTLDKCNQTNLSIDSITITKTTAGGMVDPDFPNSPIGSYPNPVKDKVHVSGLSATKSYTIQIYNNQGVQVSQVTVHGQTEVNINSVSLQSGVYWLQVYDNSRNKKIGITMLLKSR